MACRRRDRLTPDSGRRWRPRDRDQLQGGLVPGQVRLTSGKLPDLENVAHEVRGLLARELSGIVRWHRGLDLAHQVRERLTGPGRDELVSGQRRAAVAAKGVAMT